MVLGRGARQFIAPNDVTVTYYSWTCVQNCIQPEFQWFSLVREKYELTSVPKIYSILTPERDGQQVNVRIKAPVPMTVALLPSDLADQVYDNPGALSSALSKTSCKQRGVQSLSFDCTVNLADGRQSLVVVPDAGKIPHKKAEIELQTVKCSANCDMLTLGQYLQPSLKHLPVVDFVPPEKFEEYGDRARAMGFVHVASGPMVRSSYHADEFKAPLLR